MTVKRIYPGSKITLQTVVKLSDIATAAPEISLKWDIGTNGIKTVTPTNSAPGTYTADITLPDDQSGLLRYRWDTDGTIDHVDEGVLLVEPTSFGKTTSRDYM